MDTAGTSSVGVGKDHESQDADVAELIAELKPAQRVALDALALGLSVGAAAEKAGVHRGTVSRWILTDAAFIAALNAVELEMIRVGHNRLLSLIPAALAALEEAIEAGNVHAALQVLKNTLFARRGVGSISPPVIAKELEVAALQRDVALHKPQTDVLEVREETIARDENVEHKRRWRLLEEERKAADDKERRLRWAAQEQAEKKAQEAAQQRAAETRKRAVEAPKPDATAKAVESPGAHPGHSPLNECAAQPSTRPASQPVNSAASVAQSASHAVSSTRRDARITAAVQSTTNALTNPGTSASQPKPLSPSARPNQPGEPK